MKKKNKLVQFVKDHKMSLFVIVSVIIMLVGLSYAWLQLMLKGEKELTLKAGSLVLNLDESMSGGISVTDAVPVTDEEGLTSTSYTFTLENTGIIDSNYEIYLDDLDIPEDKTRMQDTFIKYELTKEGERIGFALLNTIGENPKRLLDKGEISSKEKYTYTLKMWIDQNATNEVMETVFKGNLRVEAIQGANKKLVKKLLEKTNSIENTDGATEEEIKEMFTVHHTGGVQQAGWTFDELTDYRYMGATPNNYVTFNDEVWRIIGVFTVEDEKGKKEQQVKIIRNESIGQYSWDNKKAGIGSSDSDESGSNDWSDSILQQVLNTGAYYNRISGLCPYEDKMRTCDFNDIGLTDMSKSMIAKTTWYLGKISSGKQTADAMYTEERGIATFNNRNVNFVGEVGLMYPSDYGYAAGSSSCLSNFLENYNNCIANNWLFNNIDEWLLNPGPDHSASVSMIVKTGPWSRTYASNLNPEIRPVVYLKSNVLVVKGDGSSKNPYQLQL